MARRTVRRPALDALRGEEKLQLLEFLLSSEDGAECARHATRWLRVQAGAKRALCAGLDAGGTRLVGLASAGLDPVEASAFSLDLDHRADPLAAALARTQPVTVDLERRPGLPAGTYLALPLHGLFLEEDVLGGLLLASPVLPSIVREARWLAGALGPRLTRLRSYRALSDGQKRLDRERALLQGVIDASSDPILLTDTDGRMVFANTAAENLLASRDDESEGRRRAVALNNMLFSAALSWAAGAAEREPVRRELLLADPQEGSDLLFELISSRVADPRGAAGVVSILRNVTDLRRATEVIEENYRKLRLAEADVRADRDRLNLVMDAVADPILVTDPAGRIIQMNTPAERLFMASRGSETGTLRIPANDAHFSSFVSNLFFTAGTARYSAVVGLTDPETGASLPFDATAAKVLSDHGELIGAVTILHDRTEALERERLYEQLKAASSQLEEKVRQATAELVRQNELLRRQQVELEQASAAKSQFLANMSHEFRTPLNAILGYTRMLLHGVSGPLGGEQAEDLRRVDSNAGMLLSLINDILDISRIEAGKMPVNVAEFAVPELVAEVLAELDPIIARSGLAVTTDVDAGAAQLRSDRQKVKQIVLNLLSNALKFTHEGGITLAASARPDGEMWIAVTDTGIGIAPGNLQKIFEDFEQVDSSLTREYGGTGLGLAISARLASMLGGRIALASELGKGSTFTLILPAWGDRE